MDWLKDRLRAWLFPQELHSLRQAVQDQEQLHSLLQSSLASAAETPRLTLEDLQLTPAEQLTLKSCDQAFRHALWKSGEHFCLTAYPECCRKTAVGLREYQRSLTLSPKNRIPSLDDTPFEKADQRSKKFFTPRDAQ